MKAEMAADYLEASETAKLGIRDREPEDCAVGYPSLYKKRWHTVRVDMLDASK